MRTALMGNPVAARVARTVLAARAAIVRPPFVPPGHWASPLSSSYDVARALGWQRGSPPGVDLRRRASAEGGPRARPDVGGALSRAPLLDRERDVPGCRRGGLPGDARHLRPGRVLEIGSGYSTAIALDTAERHLPELELRCVEPYPRPALGLLEPRRPGRARTLLCPGPAAGPSMPQLAGRRRPLHRLIARSEAGVGRRLVVPLRPAAPVAGRGGPRARRLLAVRVPARVASASGGTGPRATCSTHF